MQIEHCDVKCTCYKPSCKLCRQRVMNRYYAKIKTGLKVEKPSLIDRITCRCGECKKCRHREAVRRYRWRIAVKLEAIRKRIDQINRLRDISEAYRGDVNRGFASY